MLTPVSRGTAAVLSAATGHFNRRRLLVLAYHGVDDAEAFSRQMEYLVSRWRPVSLSEVHRSIRTGVALPPRSMLVTFDDGDRTVLEVGAPVMRRLGIAAALFVITDLIGGDEPFWWDEVAALVAAGGRTPVATLDGPDLVRYLKTVPDSERRRVIDELRASARCAAPRRSHLRADELRRLEEMGVAIGSHTASHPCLDRCDEDVITRELTDSRNHLEVVLGHEVRSLAYPNGNVSPLVERLAAEAGYEVAFGFDHRVSANPAPDPLSVSRVRVDSAQGLTRFRLLASGAHPTLHRLRGRG